VPAVFIAYHLVVGFNYIPIWFTQLEDTNYNSYLVIPIGGHQSQFSLLVTCTCSLVVTGARIVLVLRLGRIFIEVTGTVLVCTEINLRGRRRAPLEIDYMQFHWMLHFGI